ncbi:helix-turn-helix domain-containing protein [Williamsia muralis]|uniref:helix-turn-helix domain-containing protein n=1 Tax=Williamsia marianensis TaxID=85044 RepID=UPI003F18302C
MERQRGNESGPVSQIVAAEVSRRRQEFGWTRQVLADDVSSRGRKFTAEAIQKLESNQRRIDVDDLAALAAALYCEPSELLGRPEFDLSALTDKDVAAIQHLIGRLSRA